MVKLNAMPAGSIIKFAGRDWILLDPATGYIYSKNPVTSEKWDTNTSYTPTFLIDPKRSNNIGNYLNNNEIRTNNFYGSLTTEQKQMIVPRVWNIGFENNEAASKITADVGLISYSEALKYKDLIGTSNTVAIWTITLKSGFVANAWYIGPGGYMFGHNPVDQVYLVHPTLTLKPTLSVVNGDVVNNVAPTQPGAFTQPSGTLEIGDARTISWGASTDENGNLSKYILEASINGGAFTQIGTPTSPSFTYTIPTATSIQFRVKAMDSEGLESSYRTSSVYTVIEPQYYWSKYNVESTSIYGDTAPWIGVIESQGWFGGAKGYSFDPKNNRYRVSTDEWQVGEYASYGSKGYYVEDDGKKLKEFQAQDGTTVGSIITVHLRTKDARENSTVNTEHKKGSIITNNIQSGYNAYTNDARNSDGYWYVRGSRVNQSIAPPAPFTSPSQGKKFKPNEVANIVFGASSAANLALYEVDYRYNSTGTWTQLAYNNMLTRSLTITTDKALKTLELRVRAKNTSNVYSDYVYSEPFTIEHNVAPTVSLTSPSENVILYETDILNIAGTAHDADADQAVTVYYQINSEPKKVLATNLSQMQIPLSKTLTFKSGKLYDGETVITGSLTDGVAHKLKVWAEDSEKASSAIVEKSFYVVPNRAPLLSVDAVVPSGVVDADKFKISGTASDQDANSSVKVTRRINNGNAVEIYSGQGGSWEFDVSLAQLQAGENTIVVEVIDNYGAKTSKTIKLDKNEVKTPILHSVARYKITPPAGSAKGVLLFIERDEALDLKVELSMTLAGEQEQYVVLTPDGTAPMPNTVGIVEDTYFHEATEPKDNIILKLSTTRSDATVNHKIHLISGAVE
ncbi:hypothetical protein ACQKNB_12175 [Lysinibacillus xylanilyticus]|uniref:hypothetical protein n=1 Tax=Lysinibacillus xylanilyticus TaxID=582475 RepID=UPI003CFCFC1F